MTKLTKDQTIILETINEFLYELDKTAFIVTYTNQPTTTECLYRFHWRFRRPYLQINFYYLGDNSFDIMNRLDELYEYLQSDQLDVWYKNSRAFYNFMDNLLYNVQNNDLI
jgi:hypothetical protein